MKSLQVDILKRALGDKEVAEIIEEYKQNYLRPTRNSKPTDKHVRLAALGKKWGAAEAGRKAGVSSSLVDYAMSRVARYEWLNK